MLIITFLNIVENTNKNVVHSLFTYLNLTLNS